MRPYLSIVIPSHNRADLLRRCLASVYRHAPADTEIIVVDDASPDHAVSRTVHESVGPASRRSSISQAESVGPASRRSSPQTGETPVPPEATGETPVPPEATGETPVPPEPTGETPVPPSTSVQVLRLPRRRGFCAAVNAGIRAARNPIVELLNDDTEVSAGWAKAALDHFLNPQVAAVAPLVLRGSPSENRAPIDSAGDRYFIGGVAGKRGHGQALTSAYLHGGEVFGASASSAFYRRQALLDVGMFPEEFGAYFEDVDVSFRLHWAGYRIRYEPASRIWHRVSASHGRLSRRLLEQQSRNEERVFWRNLPDRALLRALPWHGAVLVAKAYRRWQEGEWLPFVLGRLRTLTEAAALFRHRHRLRQTNANPDTAAWGVEGRLWT